MKTVHVMPVLLLQKPYKSSKSKDHHAALKRRLKLWEEGKIEELLYEGQTIQERLKSPDSTVTKISIKFRLLMSKGNVNGALKFLKNNMSNGILSLTDATLQLLKQKHPESRQPPPEVLIEGQIRKIHPVVYGDIDESLILKAATLTKGESGPSGLDADGWRRILTSREFGTSSSDLRKTFTQLIKRLCIEELETTISLEAFTACRLIPLDKKPGLRPVGVVEVLRRIAGKVIMMIFKKDITDTAGPLQLSAGQEAGTEAAIHAMRDVFANEGTEAVLLIDAKNAFNSINRKVLPQHLNFICPVITKYITNCYITSARLF